MTDGSMPITEAIILGIVQGVTEFLPISSTAHLRIVPALLGWGDPGAAYSAVIQLGSVLAVFGYFWKDIVTITGGALSAARKQDFGDHNVRLLGGILLGTLPICILGLLLKHMLEADNSPLRSLFVIGGASIFMACFLFLAEKIGTHKRTLADIGARDGLLVGLGQAMALIPGCSRSGSTLTVAMFLNLNRADAARFSFLLGIPATLLGGLVELKHMFEAGLSNAGTIDLIVGLVVSAVVSYAAIAWLIKYLQNHATWVFVGYRLIFGAVVITLAAKQLIH
jgi:undecaprenyl-diphosphatase